MDYQTQLNNFLKKTRFNLLQFDIQNNNNDPSNTLYKANLKLIIENKPLRGESNWESSIEEAKNQCSKRVYDFLNSEPHFDINRPPETEPLFKKRNILFASIILNYILFIIIFPKGLIFFIPFYILVSIFLIVPWILYGDKRILMSTGNRVIARNDKSYEIYHLPIKYNNIILDLIQTQDIGNESPIYKIVPGCGFRVRKSSGGSYSCLVIIIKNGKQLYYHSTDILEDSFFQTSIPIFKVMSKSGIHYFPEQYSKPIEMNSFQKIRNDVMF
ncbi:hypothetical protein ACTFIY_011983 [Dictyostelium cf. discoideum]